MEYTLLGKSGIEVSRLALGGWQAHGWSKSDPQEFRRIVNAALSAGVTLFDTAEEYGRGVSESLLGEVLQSNRQQVIIATKFSYKKAAPHKIRESLEGSLRRLRTDYVDLYQQHWPHWQVPLQDTIGELVQLRSEGKIRAIGVSNWMEPEWAEIGALREEISSLQPCYSLLWRSVERSVKEICINNEIAILPYSPLAQGILAGRFPLNSDLPPDSRNANVLLKDVKFKQVVEFMTVIEQIAHKHSATSAQVALAWLLAQEGVTAPIIGATSVPQLQENLLALELRLDREDLSKLDIESAPLSEELHPHDSIWNWHPRRQFAN